MIIYIAQISSRWLFIRGHSRNQPKGGHKPRTPCINVIPLNDPPLQVFFSDHISQFMLKKSPEASSKAFKGLYLMCFVLNCAQFTESESV